MNIKITENQYKVLLSESFEEEGFDFRRKNTEMYFNPNHQRGADTSIFKDDSKDINVREKILPKSGVVSYNLYQINKMDINKGLKHNRNANGEVMSNGISFHNNGEQYDTIDWFINRSVMYIKYILKDKPVDIITYPQSSSDFNKKVTERLIQKYPKSEGIKLQPELLVKNVRNIFVNVEVAKSIGLTDTEIHNLQSQVAKWQKDEDIRDVRRKMDALLDKINDVIATRKRGRPSKEFTDMQQQYSDMQQQVSNLRKHQKGKDPTIDKNGRTKEWQIKSIDDKNRKSIEGVFDINPAYKQMQYKLKGKSVVVFDDNISSGATLDDVCLALQKIGVKNIIPITLGVIDPTIYDQQARNDYMRNKRNK